MSNGTQRAGIADGGEFYIRPPEPLPGFDKDKYLRTKAGPCSSSPEPQHSIRPTKHILPANLATYNFA